MDKRDYDPTSHSSSILTSTSASHSSYSRPGQDLLGGPGEMSVAKEEEADEYRQSYGERQRLRLVVIATQEGKRRRNLAGGVEMA